MSPKKLEPVAIVGVSALFPGSLDKTGFWSDILAGADRMSAVPALRSKPCLAHFLLVSALPLLLPSVRPTT